MVRPVRYALWAALLYMAAASAVEVTQSIGQYRANADWVTSSEGGQKPVVLIVHGTMGHKDMELVQQTQELLQENGYDSLAINLTLNRDNRRGFMPCDVPQTHRHEDAMREIAAWSRWLRDQSRHEIVLLGHSRGGLQVAQYQAETADSAVQALAMLAPMANRRQKNEDRSAKKQPGKQFLHCPDAPSVSEQSRKSYARSGGVSLTEALSRVTVPADVFIGSEDNSTAVITSDEIRWDPELRHVDAHLIEGADHFFRDLYLDEVIEILVERWAE